MDILETNFPHMFPKKPTVQSIVNAVKTTVTSGDRGCASNETVQFENVVQCDQAYLDSIMDQLRAIELEIWLYSNVINDTHRGKRSRNLINQDPTQHVFQALAELSQLVPVLVRLESNLELFSDVRMRRHFFQQAEKTTKLSKQLLLMCKERGSIVADATAREQQAKASYPLNPKIGQEYKPWQSWCRQLPLKENSAIVKEMKQKHSNMQIFSSQLLPAQGVLIAEHWRSKVDTVVTSIMGSSAHPEVVAKQMPKTEKHLSRSKCKEGIAAIEQRRVPMMPHNDTMRKAFTFGAQEPVAKQARSMAMLAGDVTTRGDRAGAARVSFLNPEGMLRASKSESSE